jgi:hypothetical protein
MSLVGFTWQAPVGKNGYALATRRWKFSRWPNRERELGSRLSDVLNREIKSGEAVEVLLIEPQEGAGYRTYSPLREETGLFRIFADTEQTPEGCLSFAVRYGLLERYGPLECHRANLPGSPPKSELVLEWLREIRLLKYLVTLWELARDGDEKSLAGFVRWEGPRVCFGGAPPDTPLYQWPFRSYTTREGWTICKDQAGRIIIEGVGGHRPVLRPGDLITSALLFCLLEVNTQLRASRTCMVWDEEREGPGIQIVPASLFSAMYLQFALAIDGNRQFQRCPACGRWFQLSPGLNRANKQTCSGSCRTGLHRRRAQQAVRLHAEGRTVKQIAKQVGSTVEKVKSWIEKHQRKGK